MTASNPCCECKWPHPRDHSNICDTCGLRCDLLPIKETPAAVEMVVPQMNYMELGEWTHCLFCHNDIPRDVVIEHWQSHGGKTSTSACRQSCSFSKVPNLYKPPQPEKDIEENLRLMNHGIIYQQPAKEWWEELFDAIFSNRMSVDSASGEQVFFKQKVELIKSFISRIAAQSEKKGRDEREKEILAAIDATAYDEARAARSSEEGKTV